MYKKKWFQNFLAVLILAAISLPIILIERHDTRKLHENGEETIGTIVGFGRRNSVIWEYILDGRIYKIREQGRFIDGLKIGEQFMALVNPQDTKMGIMHFHRPYFEEKDIDSVLVYNFPNGPPQMDRVTITYQYVVNNKIYERKQRLPYGLERDSLVNANSFFVVYYVKKPEIGYIFPLLEPE
ncbi:MAG: hypothetical protein Q8J69_03855 [Sphingobacteriaceae bacterium]|nr:hypothetical protein [Sphingobacteriaceae bacterium]